MEEARTILIIDDNPDDRTLAERELLKEFPPKSIRIKHIKDDNEFEQALQSRNLHLVITDYYLRWSNGLDILHRVKSVCPHCPVIMFTASGNEEVAVQAMKEGLDDYISKKTQNFVRLRRAVSTLLKSSAAMQRVGAVEARLQTLLERLNVGVFRSTPDGRLIEANPACLRILGLQSREEAEHINLAEFYTSISDRKRLLQSLYEKGYLHEKEIQLRRRDGKIIWVAVTEILDRQADGEIFIEGILEDISQRKEAEIALKESEERYRQLVEHSPFAMIVHYKGVVQYVNPAAVQLLKARSPEDLLGKNVMEFVHPDFCEIVRERMQRMAQQRLPLELLHEKLVCVDGTVIDAEVMALPVTFDGRPAAQVVIRDITRQMQMEEELKRREAQFRLLIENASDIIAVVDANGQLRYRSPSVRALLGYELDEVQNMSVFDLIHPEDVHRTRNQFIRLLREQGANSPYLRFRLRHKNGEWRMLEAVAKNLLHDPAIQGIVVNARDVTDRIILEEQLYQSQKMEAIGRLAGGIAHDFNNLLTAIQGYADLVLHELPDTDPLREDVAEIARATQRATALTRQLLTFSRKQILKPRIIHLNQILADMENMLSRLIGENIDLIIRMSPDLHTVKADPSQIEQVIMNLAVNARDAMPEGGKLMIETRNVLLDDLYVSKHKEMSPGEYVMMAFTDTGIGMDHSTRERAFEPFFTTKERGKGTGLGLSLVYGIVKQSGGSIFVYSERGMGTTIKIYLPRSKQKTDIEETQTVDLSNLRGEETILVVEDEDLLRELARRVLESYGYRVLDAPNAEVAIELCKQRQEPIHLLLTDVVLPKMNGRQLAEYLLSERPGIQILFMSGYTDDVVLTREIIDKRFEFLQKPFTTEMLVQKIRKILDHQPQEASP